MTRSDFRELFIHALDRAAEQVEARLGTRIPRSFPIELHAPGCAGQRVSVERALDHLYLGDDRLYRVIDTAITLVLPDTAVAFVRVGGHPPAGFETTWNPAALGPFKQILSEHVKDQRVNSG